MPFRKICDGTKHTAMLLADRGRDTVAEILDVAQMSRATFYRMRERWNRTGSIARRRVLRAGRPRKLSHTLVNETVRWVERSSTLYLRQLRRRLYFRSGMEISISTVHRTLKRRGITLKKVEKVASERDPLKVADYIRRISRYTQEQLVFVDECSKDDRTCFRQYGRGPSGQTVTVRGPFIRGDRYSLLPALDVNGIFAYKTVKGSFTKARFYDFIRNHVVCRLRYDVWVVLTVLQLPQCRPYPGPRSVIIADNARIHHDPVIKNLCDLAGACLYLVYLNLWLRIPSGVKLEYLPPYSPHLNPIELCFGIIKRHIRSVGEEFNTASSAYTALADACDVITSEIARNCFEHDGYTRVI